MRPTSAIALSCSLIAVGCLPYNAGTTAQPAPVHEFEQTANVYVLPNAATVPGTRRHTALIGGDYEIRTGLTHRSDLALRSPSFSGLLLNYKYRLTPSDDSNRTALAYMVGGGFVNWAQHAELDATLIASGPRRQNGTLYGGLRIIQVIPIEQGAPHDDPSMGGFLGMRFGRADFGMSPELAVYYDRSALKLRKSNIILVPALNVHGEDLIRMLRQVMGIGMRAR